MKRQNESATEIRGAERAFQLNRDTLLVYTGLHPRDFRPFIRFGSSPNSVPMGLLKHIENVVLPEDEPVNAGVEVAWIDATLRAGSEHIRYVGSRERISQINSFAGLREEKGEPAPIESLAYRAKIGSGGAERDKSMLTFFATGNVNVTVGGARVLDYASFKRGVLHIDREYELFTRALQKRERKCEKGVGFLFPDESIAGQISLYWHFDREGLFVNPPVDPHYVLFQNGIDPDRASMVASASPYGPGFTEILRRKNAESKEVGIFCPDQERLAILKKIYNRAAFKQYEDMRPLPFARGTVSFVSRSGSHMLFAIKPHKGSRDVLALFPLGAGKKVSKSFSYFKAPFDFEIFRYNSKADLESRAGRLLLVVPGQIKEKAFRKLKLSADFFPLVKWREYRIHSSEVAADLVDHFSAPLKGSTYHDLVHEILLQSIGFEYDAARLAHLLSELVKLPAAADVQIQNSIHMALKFVRELPEYETLYDSYARKQMARLDKRFSLRKWRFGDWLDLAVAGVYMELVILRGRMYMLTSPAPAEPVRFPLPPGIEELEKDSRSFVRVLRRVEKDILRSGDHSLSFSLDAVSKIFQERLRLAAERRRFYGLLEHLGIQLSVNEPDYIHKSLPPAVNEFLVKVRSVYRRFVARVREMFAG